MIKQLKKRVVIAAMISVTVVLIFIIGAINALNYQSIIKDVDDILREIHNNGGAFPEEKDDNGSDLHAPFEVFPNSQEQPYKDRYFTMIYDGHTFSHIQNTFNHDKAKELGNKIVNQRRSRGSLMDLTGIYRYYLDTELDNSGNYHTRITLIDFTITMQNYYTFFALSIAVSAASLLIIFALMMIFATRIISPIAESYEKQKRFITDAGHDIKTPITIIDADREILEMDIGENEWLEDIKRQTKRLTKLTNDLIYLSRMEEGTDLKELSSFSISTVCLEEADSFSAVAKTKELEITTDIEENIDINGSEEDVRKLLAILFDNAIKYASGGTKIGINLRKHGRIATVTISNVAENMDEGQTKKMFDRFYRADSARGSEGGFGIGLAMAQAITLSHNGKISADLSDDKVLSISASFPVQFGSFKLITNLVDKNARNVNNTSQISNNNNSESYKEQNKSFDNVEKDSASIEIDKSDIYQEETDINCAESSTKEEDSDGDKNPTEESEHTDKEGENL